MITILPETTKEPLQKIGYMAGVCWNSPVDDKEKNKKRAIECIKSGHGRVLEYVDIELVIDGYSARVIREWYTHIAGGPTRLQESTRYVNEGNFNYVTPPKIQNLSYAQYLYDECMNKIKETYKELEELGIAKEDCANILPLGMTTKIVDKRNLRNLAEMSHKRLCARAYHEYRYLMTDIIKALENYSEEWKEISGLLFKPQCDVLGYCPEKKSCGRK